MLYWEENTCDWCNESDGELLFEGMDLLMGLPGRFRMVRCKHCGLIRQNPRLKWDSLKKYYPDDYTAYEPIIHTETSPWKRLDRRYGMWKRLRAIERLSPGGRLLDVGCGTGIFLAEAQRTGKWELFGLDPSEKVASYVREHLNIPILQARFEEIGFPPKSFDVITMWNVLEHFNHPITELKRAHELLVDGGWLIFSIPNLESWEAKAFGRYWLGWDLPRHLYLFPRKELRSILSELGFHLESMRCLATAHAALGLSLDFLLKTWLGSDSSIRHLLLRLYRSMPIRLITAIPFRILDELKSSSLITVFAQKVCDQLSKVNQ
jgi:2-polyprenyl-3-methyl-5-hydroxy-6-metoxy-1,4-benzoquinol methylase